MLMRDRSTPRRGPPYHQAPKKNTGSAPHGPPARSSEEDLMTSTSGSPETVLYRAMRRGERFGELAR